MKAAVTTTQPAVDDKRLMQVCETVEAGCASEMGDAEGGKSKLNHMGRHCPVPCSHPPIRRATRAPACRIRTRMSGAVLLVQDRFSTATHAEPPCALKPSLDASVGSSSSSCSSRGSPQRANSRRCVESACRDCASGLGSDDSHSRLDSTRSGKATQSMPCMCLASIAIQLWTFAGRAKCGVSSRRRLRPSSHDMKHFRLLLRFLLLLLLVPLCQGASCFKSSGDVWISASSLCQPAQRLRCTVCVAKLSIAYHYL